MTDVTCFFSSRLSQASKSSTYCSLSGTGFSSVHDVATKNCAWIPKTKWQV
jgi:hypothetical protein